MNLDSLNDTLNETFHGRIRARQSLAYEDRFFIEEHTARGSFNVVADFKSTCRAQFKQRADVIQRVADGYSWVMEVRHGAAFGCMACGARNRCPINETAEVRCLKCQHQQYVAHYPEMASLVTHLRLIDPLQGAELRARVKDADGAKTFKDKDELRQLNNQGGGYLYDELIGQLPTARLSGRTSMWIQE